MTVIQWKTKITVRGAVMDGNEAEREVTRFLNDLVHDVADHGKDLVQLDFDQVHRNPSTPPYARSKVSVEHFPGPRSTIGDGGLIYGPWLEGTGSRNKTTRFKGYRTFRRIGQELDRRARLIADDMLPRLINKLNGK